MATNDSITASVDQINESLTPTPTTTTPTKIASTVIKNGCQFNQPELGTATRLIELVKSHPELYDKTHRLYCNNVHKGVLWHRITDEIGGTSAKKTREQFSYMRKRFRNEYEGRKKGTQSFRGLVPEPDASNYRQPLFVYEQLAFLEEMFEKEDSQENSNITESVIKVETAAKSSPQGAAIMAAAERFVRDEALPIIENSSSKGIFGVSPQKRPRIQSPTEQLFLNEISSSSSASSTTISSSINPFDSALFAAFLNNSLNPQLQSPPPSSTYPIPVEADEECQIFGRQVAMDLQRLHVHTRIRARQRITKILLELYLKQCENQGH